MKIRVTKKGEHAVILMRSGWPEGTVLDVSKADGDAFIREGNGELVTEGQAPPPEDEEAEEEEQEGQAESEAETTTAEPAGETAVQKPPRRRRGG